MWGCSRIGLITTKTETEKKLKNKTLLDDSFECVHACVMSMCNVDKDKRNSNYQTKLHRQICTLKSQQCQHQIFVGSHFK